VQNTNEDSASKPNIMEKEVDELYTDLQRLIAEKVRCIQQNKVRKQQLNAEHKKHVQRFDTEIQRLKAEPNDQLTVEDHIHRYIKLLRLRTEHEIYALQFELRLGGIMAEEEEWLAKLDNLGQRRDEKVETFLIRAGITPEDLLSKPDESQAKFKAWVAEEKELEVEGKRMQCLENETDQSAVSELATGVASVAQSKSVTPAAAQAKPDSPSVNPSNMPSDSTPARTSPQPPSTVSLGKKKRDGGKRNCGLIAKAKDQSKAPSGADGREQE